MPRAINRNWSVSGDTVSLFSITVYKFCVCLPSALEPLPLLKLCLTVNGFVTAVKPLGVSWISIGQLSFLGFSIRGFQTVAHELHSGRLQHICGFVAKEGTEYSYWFLIGIFVASSDDCTTFGILWNSICYSDEIQYVSNKRSNKSTINNHAAATAGRKIIMYTKQVSRGPWEKKPTPNKFGNHCFTESVALT